MSKNTRSLPRPYNSGFQSNAPKFNNVGPYSQLNMRVSLEPPVNSQQPQVEESDDVDYTFSRMSVRERSRMFMDGDGSGNRMNHSMTLPRSRSRNAYAQYDTQSEMGDWGPPIQPSWVPAANSAPKVNNSVYRNITTSSRTLDLASNRLRNLEGQLSRNLDRFPQSSYATPTFDEQYIQPSYAAPRQSRPQYRPQYGTQIQPTEFVQPNRSQPSGTQVYTIRRYNSTAGIRDHDTASACGDLWTGSRPQSSQPLKVNVYNSDRPAMQVSPQHRSYANQNWSQPSPVYPAYPAYNSRPLDSGARVYRVVQSPSRMSRGMSEEPHGLAPQSRATVVVPLSSKARIMGGGQKPATRYTPLTIYPSAAPAPVYQAPRTHIYQAPRSQVQQWAPLSPQRRPVQSPQRIIRSTPIVRSHQFNAAAAVHNEEAGVSEF